MAFAIGTAKAIFYRRREGRRPNGTVVKHDIRYRISDFSVILFVAPRRSKAGCDSCCTRFVKMKYHFTKMYESCHLVVLVNAYNLR